MKCFKVFVVLGILAALSIPVANLLMPQPRSAKLDAATKGDPLFAKVADILQNKCSHCHTEDAGLPFYAKAPLVSTLIQKDVDSGLKHLNMTTDLAPGGKTLSEPALAKIEYSIAQNAMPPMQYVAMHWNTTLSGSDETAIKKWIGLTRAEHYADAALPDDLKKAVIRPLPLKHSQNAVKAALGKKLFNDKRLSKDNTISCASCHAMDKGGTDQEAVSTGVNKQKGPINSPTVFNAMYNVKQFWDGRAKDLQDQAAGPVENPIEMAEKWDNVIVKLKADTAFNAEFKVAYPDGLSKKNVTHAIAVFEETLITPNCKFDKFLAGDTKSLNQAEQAGWRLFQLNACATCHCGAAMGGQSFELMGRKKNYFTQSGRELTKEDNGLSNFTKNESDKHKFKVPTLRNIAITFPYFHDAGAKDLETAVKVMADVQSGRSLSQPQIDNVVAFLKTLTGELEGKTLVPTTKPAE
ncbi:MAG: c-type cytochrome [Phycisphaerales bacterium]|nr:c-type cytochrome [Phycisphaerales bacterium]